MCLFGSDPDLGLDDCWTGETFDSLADARACFEHPFETFSSFYFGDSVFVELDGPDFHGKRRLRADRKRPTDDAWRREAATQAGMAGGCHAYNDTMEAWAG